MLSATRFTLPPTLLQDLRVSVLIIPLIVLSFPDRGLAVSVFSVSLCFLCVFLLYILFILFILFILLLLFLFRPSLFHPSSVVVFIAPARTETETIRNRDRPRKVTVTLQNMTPKCKKESYRRRPTESRPKPFLSRWSGLKKPCHDFR